MLNRRQRKIKTRHTIGQHLSTLANYEPKEGLNYLKENLHDNTSFQNSNKKLSSSFRILSKEKVEFPRGAWYTKIPKRTEQIYRYEKLKTGKNARNHIELQLMFTSNA